MSTLKLAYVTKLLRLVDVTPDPPASLVVEKNIPYKVLSSKTLELDIYRQKDITEAQPLLIFVHGGAWKSGDRDDYRRYLVDYALKGFITATVSYRLSQDAPYPAALQDVACALDWLTENATDHFIDPTRIAMVGGSAGGHLAMLTAYHGLDSSFTAECSIGQKGQLKAIVNFYGPSDLTTEISINHPSVAKFLGADYSDAVHHLYEASSPINYLDNADPPTLIFHGTLDDIVPVAQSDHLKVELDKLGVSCQYFRLEGWPHTMDAGLKVNQYCQIKMDAFFDQYLR